MSKITQKKKLAKKMTKQNKESSFRPIISLEEINNLELNKYSLYLLEPKKNYTLDFYLIEKNENSLDLSTANEYIKKYPEHKHSQLVDLMVGFSAEKEVYDELAKIKTIYSYDVDIYSESFITTYKNLKIWLEELISEGKLFIEEAL